MKKYPFLFIATIGLIVSSCGAPVEVDIDITEEISYSLDAENSSLAWKGSKDADYYHTGVVSFSEGSLKMKGEELIEGAFVVDMESLETTDENKEDGEVLIGHLRGTMVDERHPQDLFFNTPEFPEVKVSLQGYKDGNLTTTLEILGQKLTQDVAVELSSDENGASIVGKFEIDMTPIGIPGLQKDEEGNGLSPMVEFDLNVKLKK